MTIFGFGIWFLGFPNDLKKIPKKLSLAFKCFFLHYEWFVQNFEKDFISNNMHMIVPTVFP